MAMQTEHTKTSQQKASHRTPEIFDETRVAIFTMPKSFADPHINLIQRNAIQSWQSLGDTVEVILIGDDPGIAEAAIEFDIRHHVEVDRNGFGTPLVSHAFHIAKDLTDAEVLVYCNADTILLPDFKTAIQRIANGPIAQRFLAIGRRTNLDIVEAVDFSDPSAVMQLRQNAITSGRPASIVCKEFFAFSRGLFEDIPDFAVGRGNWDNWMVAYAKSIGVPVIDVSAMVLTIHQNHDYHHLPTERRRGQSQTDTISPRGVAGLKKGLRKQCYLSGEEAKENQRLAGGKHIVNGSTTTCRLTQSGVVENRFAWLNLRFWVDLPRFLRLVNQLFRN